MWPGSSGSYFLDDAVVSCRAVNLVPPERNREEMDEELIAAMAGGDRSAATKRGVSHVFRKERHER
jgi:hypothetical protein